MYASLCLLEIGAFKCPVRETFLLTYLLLSLRTRSRRGMGSGGEAAMDISTASAKPCQFTSFVFHRERRWVTEGFGTWQLMPIVLGRWSDPRSSPNAHSSLVAQVLLTMVTPGVLSPPMARLTCLGSLLFRMLMFLKISQSSTVGWLVFVPGGRMDVKITCS